MLDEAEKTIFEISARRSPCKFRAVDYLAEKNVSAAFAAQGSGQGDYRVSLLNISVDEMTSGFQKGDLIVLAARPSMGKTALALSLARNAARGARWAFFRLRWVREQLMLRLLSAESRIAHQTIRNATITSDEWIGSDAGCRAVGRGKNYLLMILQC